ncbi:RING-type E3 ubiquitin transferase [Pseudomonas sp. IT-347P]|uniref:NEL-type E3 ubiquitin ligase domain-containing protein n=1 Tax=Pseudomonas sp. IT-347P TaxID=3026458 RepID=UPI0039E10062
MITAQDKPAPQAPTHQETLGVLLEATGDLDTAEALQESLPESLLKSSASTLAALDLTARELHAVQLRVEKDLLKLKPLNDFCKKELTEAMNRKWSAVFNVEKDLLSLPGPDCGCSPVTTDDKAVEAVPHATQTLLQAAMQNFTDDEEADGFPSGSLVRVSSAPAGVAGLTPASFAGFCRELDLGKRYQKHFQEVFGLQDADGKVVATSPMTRDIAALKKQLLQLDMHLAGLRRHITPASVRTLQRLIDADGVVSAKNLHHKGRPLIMQGIEIFDSCIWGVVVFSVNSLASHPDEGCLVYAANEPDRPLYEYASFTAFKEYLAGKLKEKNYKNYFANCLDEDDKADFFKTLVSRADLGTITPLPIKVPLFEFMVQSHVGKLQIDARKLAVPTEDIDEDVRQKRLLDFLELGVTLATVAGFFVPVVGQLMMGVAVGQLLAEVYEGVEDWRRGDHQEALSHVLSVVENIVVMGLFAGGQKVVGTLGRKLVKAQPAFFGQFAPITNTAGKARLWKPDLTPYEHRLPVGFTVASDSEEVFEIRDKTVGRVDHRIVSGSIDAQTRRWRLEHPLRADAYSPELERHIEGGWRLAHEDPAQWSSTPYTLKRMDPHLSEFVDNDLDMMRRLSGVSHEQLQRAAADNLALPVRLRDTVERLRIERQLRQLIIELGSGETHAGQPVEEQLHGLAKLPGWPADRYIEVADEDANVTARYPAPQRPDDKLSVPVSQEQLDSGQLLQTVIDGLYQKEVDTLVGTRVLGEGERQALAKKLAAALASDRREVFERMYARYDQSDADEVKKLRAVFADIPARYAQHLIDRAASVDRLHLRSTGRVPLRLGQKIREGMAQVRVDRALTGLHVPQVANADSDRLAIQLLPRLNGWDVGMRLAVRDKALKGPVLEAIGSESALPSSACTLVKSSQGYEAFAGDGKSLGRVAAGPDSLYAAILKALPLRQRTALGFADPVAADSARLRGKLLNVALDERKASERVLTTGKLELPVTESACIQADPVSTATTHPRALLRKVRKLYPRFSEQQASEFIDGLGTDLLARATRVKGLRADLKQLREVLAAWAEDETAMKALGGELQVVHRSRTFTAEQIEDSFRRIVMAVDESGKSVCALNLDKMHVGKLPTLPTGLNFDHVKHLSLKQMDQGDDLAYFLKAFRQVESLELDGNKLTRLPEVLSHMPNLARLSLANNQIKLTEYTLVKLSNMRTLSHLNMNYNTLDATPDVSKLLDLRSLALRDTGATELPKGIARLPSLDWVDLRYNQIKDLPAWLFKSSKRYSKAFNLRGNPLSLASSTHLADYLNNVGIGMGYLENDNARMDEYKARSLWLDEGVGTDFTRRQRIWKAFRDDPNAEGLFFLLSELGNTADSVKVNEDMRRRVWVVLEAAERDAILCDQVLNLAANPINCTDSAAINFSHLELAVEIDQVTSLAGGRITSARPLLKLGRGLFRLDQVNQIAHEHALKHPALDPLEVSLAYRIGLAETLDLPGQPQHMQFTGLAKVTAADLATAKSKVETAELSSEWLTFMLRKPFWCDYLKRTFPRQFASIQATYNEKIEALEDQRDKLSEDDLRNAMDVPQLEREQAEEKVFSRLTADAIRVMDLGLCAMSDE